MCGNVYGQIQLTWGVFGHPGALYKLPAMLINQQITCAKPRFQAGSEGVQPLHIHIETY
jgi:hypothetical protein